MWWKMVVSITKILMARDNDNVTFSLLFFLLIALTLLSLSVLTIMTNAQASTNTTSGSNSTSNETQATQMGICQVGAGGPCNGQQWFWLGL